MADHPILFKSEMIRAILDERKTQTRRVIKPQPDKILQGDWAELCKWKPGDLLWVREMLIRWCESMSPDYPYYATDKTPVVQNKYANVYEGVRLSWYWKKNTLAPIFMPKWACRLWLKVKSIRVERVQEIRACDIEAEGIDISADGIRTANHFRGDAWELWQTLWDSINTKPKPRYRTINGKKEITHYESYPWKNIHQTRRYRGKPWHVYGNPHVFVTEFERIDQ